MSEGGPGDLESLAKRADALLPQMMLVGFRVLGRRSRELGVTVPQTFLLRQLKTRGRCTAAQIAQMLSVTSGPVTGLTRRLMKRGLVRRSTDPVDRRVAWFSLTPTGEDVVAKVTGDRLVLWMTIIERLTPEERHSAVRLSEKVAHLLEALEAVPVDEGSNAQGPIKSGKRRQEDQ